MADTIDPNVTPVTPDTVPPVTPEAPQVDENLEARKQLALERQKREKLEKDINDLRAQGLKSKDDWKGLNEINEARANALEAENKQIKQAILNDAKYKVLTAEAVKAGINPASIPDLELLDFAEITTETLANGKAVVSGAAQAIANLKRQRPFWFTGEVPNVNPNTPQGGSNPPNGNVTLDMVLAAQGKYSASKSDSDKRAYEDITKKYKAQGLT